MGMSPAPGLTDPRAELWVASFDTYYDSLFEETLADALINKWGRLDDVTKVVVAITASGSAISGWALWGQPGWKIVWLVCSGLAAVLSILHSALGVPGRIKAHSDDKRRFASLRTSLETFRYRLRIEHFDADKFGKEFADYRRLYADDIGLLSNDTFRTTKFEKGIQEQVNLRIHDEIEG